jgi:hypothetical protein
LRMLNTTSPTTRKATSVLATAIRLAPS